MTIRNKKQVANIPAEITIKTNTLKKALEEYPKYGGVLVCAYEHVVMETPARGRVQCCVGITITVQRQLE